MAAFATHAQLQVQITPDEIVLEPGDSSSNVVRQTLTFDRGDGTLRISRSSTKITSSKTAASVLGLVTLHGGNILQRTTDGCLLTVPVCKGAHLILVSEATKVGLIPTVAAMGVFANVHKVVSVEVIPVLSKSKLTAQEELDNNKYLAMLREFILASNFYFSYTHDITRAAQFQDASKLAEPLYKKVYLSICYSLLLSFVAYTITMTDTRPTSDSSGTSFSCATSSSRCRASPTCPTLSCQ